MLPTVYNISRYVIVSENWSEHSNSATNSNSVQDHSPPQKDNDNPKKFFTIRLDLHYVNLKYKISTQVLQKGKFQETVKNIERNTLPLDSCDNFLPKMSVE